MQSLPLVSVIILAWNSKKYLPVCLDHLLAQTFHGFEIILVDNGSNDGASDGLREKYPSLNLHIHKLSSNQGFAVANNIGARLAHGKWLVLLNTDAFPEPDWLEKLLQATEDYPEFSCFSSRQIQANSPLFLDGAGDTYHVSGLAWRRYLGYPANQYGLEKLEVFSSCGAFLEVGGFDDAFFSYFEDVDLGFRLRLMGYRCLYVPDAVVHHIGSATLGVASDFALYHFHRNFMWSFVQNMPSPLLWKYLPAHIFANIVYLANYTLRGHRKVLWRAKWDALRGLPKVLKKRRQIQKLRRVSNADLLQAMERGWLQPYLLGYQLRRVFADI